jgi:hypothetical protein
MTLTVRMSGEQIIITLDSWKVYNHHTVCGLHFEKHYFAANNKLKNTAVPTLRFHTVSLMIFT